MINTILGTKVKMSQSFIDGARTPVTKVVAGPCVVTFIKRQEKDGYWAVQIGFGQKRLKNTTKPLRGHFEKNQTSKVKIQNYPRFVKEVRVDKEPEYKVGDSLKASDFFNVGDIVAVTGTSKGKGFAGVVKRWGFAGGPKTHGQSDRQRAPGSIGQGTTPGRVFKGKHMAGHMGVDTVTVKNLKVLSVTPEKNEVEIAGPVPGAPGGLLIIKKIKEAKKEESNA